MSALSAFLSVGMGSYWQRHSFSSIINSSNDLAAAPAVKNGMLMLRMMWVVGDIMLVVLVVLVAVVLVW